MELLSFFSLSSFSPLLGRTQIERVQKMNVHLVYVLLRTYEAYVVEWWNFYIAFGSGMGGGRGG